ncbi:MAG: hypothetical protein QOI01_213 [Mycobacterium sp.]|jgi:hypothetical protein|nr:hypothetical protein [Actinomycetota bacterium]MDT5148480.1 hypothetical protein [Mycobacterium sp.]
MLLTERRRITASGPALALFASVFAVHGVIALVVGTHGWDDGSITVAFARTFADSGRIAMTPLSEVVEGYSSPFWMLVLAATFRVLPLDFNGMLLASQLWAAIFAALGSALLYLLSRPFLKSAALPLSFVVFVSSGFFNETANGMEMTALSAAALAMIWALRTRGRMPFVFALAALIPWIRLEAAGYVIAGAVLVAVVSRDYRRATALIGGALVSVVVLTGLRLAIFDSVLPNTMLAKQSAPYPYSTTLAERLAGCKTVTKEILYVCAPGAIIAVGALLGRRPEPGVIHTALTRLRARSVTPVIGYAAGYLAGVAAANLVLGPNWGYLGRMEQSSAAVAVMFVVYCVPRATRTLQAPLRLAGVVVALLLVAAYGVDHQRVDAVAHPGDAEAITPAAYRQTGEALEVVRRALGHESMSVLTPDIGGTSLCCTNLQVLDSGLLANGELARQGYVALGGYLTTNRPDAIVTHSVWSDASHLYELPYFRPNYSPVTVDGMWFYLRNDLLDRLADRCTDIPTAATESFRYRGTEIDETYIRTLGLTSVCELR